jgi:hypothetical protein
MRNPTWLSPDCGSRLAARDDGLAALRGLLSALFNLNVRVIAVVPRA